MALTTNQRNAHIHALILNPIDGTMGDAGRQGLMMLIKACVLYSRLGADQKEAAQFLAQEIIERVTGRPATADDLHMLRAHWAPEAVPGSAGDI